MAGTHLAKDAARAEKVRALFNTIAPRYDRINDLQSLWLHRAWKRRLVQLADPQPGKRALDLCCGTGDIALALAAAGAEVTALDFSPEMLARARKCRGDAKVDFREGDALNTGQPAGHFDIVTIAYGLRNLADFDAGLREMHRVTKPGGRLLVLDFGKPTNRLWRFWYLGYLKWIVPWFGRLLCRGSPAYAYIHESFAVYPAQQGVAEAMKKLGCQEVQTHNLLAGAMAINVGVKV